MLGLGLPEWLLIIGLVGGLIITFRTMARASVAYAKAREARERQALVDASKQAEHPEHQHEQHERGSEGETK